MNLMQQIQRGKRPMPRRVLLFGVRGVGKSSFAASAPSAVFIPTEEGVNDLDCSSFPLAKSYADAVRMIEALFTEEHAFRTVAVDTLDWLEQLIWQEVCREHSAQNIESIPYGRGYTFALDHWRSFLEGLDALRAQRGMTIVLLAHNKIERFADPETDSYDRYVPRLHKLASAIVQEWSDEVLFATFQTFTRSTDEGFNRKKTRGIGTGERVIYTTERPAHAAKNRLNLPDQLPLDWNAYASFFNQPNPTNEGVTNG